MSDPKAEPAKKSKSKPSRSKQSSGTSAPKLKVVIRRLPSNLPEAIFWQSVDRWVTDETVSWKLYIKGKLRTKLNKENVPSRAYVEFLTPEAVIAFNQDYNGHLFRDKQGNESTAVVEYAPYQKVPHTTRKADTKIGTIETDEDYVSFLNALNKPPEPTPDINELAAQTSNTLTEPTSTPLLDALKAAKESSTIKGYHSHYREQSSQPRSRAQQLEDEQTFNRKAPLLPKSQQDIDTPANPVESASKDEKGKEKEGGGGGGGKKKNKQKAAIAATPAVASPGSGSSAQPKSAPPHLPKQAPSTQPSASSSSNRPAAGEPPRPRPVVGSRGGLLAALGVATEARVAASSRKSSGRQRDASGGAPTSEVPTTPTSAAPLPAGVLAIPTSSISTPAPEPPITPGKSRRGGKNRGRGGGSSAIGGGGGGEGGGASSTPSEMPRIDDPGQALPPVASSQRGGGRGSRGRGGRGRGRGRGGASGAGDQPGASTT
ncbi:hypothetical protein FRC07_004037 [Ceratobasidium sp. 392]|nr:hypothetical protein FRC07_004037 [Ceratobasidium sp. 392]